MPLWFALRWAVFTVIATHSAWMSESCVTIANLKGTKFGVLVPRALKCEFLLAKRIFPGRTVGVKALYYCNRYS
jgi:hypothetical protein